MPMEKNRSVRGIRRVGAALFVLMVFVDVAQVALRGSAQQQALTAPTDQAAIERGGELLRQQCGFCHGANARGGSSGPDLTRSVVVQEDENGIQLGAFLQAGRPDRGMPRFDLPPAQLSDLAAFLHAAIYTNSNRRLYKILDVLVGDPAAGQAYFAGPGRCTSCHSIAGDLKGIGARYEPAVLQNRMLMPRGRPSAPDTPSPPLYQQATAIRATIVTPAGESVTGAIVRLTDFDVTIWDAAANRERTWLRSGTTPKVTVVDPLQAHVDLLTKWTDTDMHNVTAYLAGLK